MTRILLHVFSDSGLTIQLQTATLPYIIRRQSKNYVTVGENLEMKWQFYFRSYRTSKKSFYFCYIVDMFLQICDFSCLRLPSTKSASSHISIIHPGLYYFYAVWLKRCLIVSGLFLLIFPIFSFKIIINISFFTLSSIIRVPLNNFFNIKPGQKDYRFK